MGRIFFLTFRLKMHSISLTFYSFLLTLLLATGGMAGEQAEPNHRVADKGQIDLSSEHYQKLFRELEQQHNFSETKLAQLFEGLRVDPKVLELMDRPWEAKPYYLYRPLFITSSTIAKGKEKLQQHRRLFDRIEAAFGVDREYLVAIWGVESKFGANQGKFKLFRTINSLFDRYPRRAAFYRRELIEFLLLCRKNGIDPLSVSGSYAGAFGQAQFIPSSFNRYAVDFDGDTRTDLINSPEDVFASIANYLKEFGWTLHAPVYAELGDSLNAELPVSIRAGKNNINWRLLAHQQQVSLPRPPKEQQLSIVQLELSPEQGGGMRYVAAYPNFTAITEYNHSDRYAMAVSEMAEAFKK